MADNRSFLARIKTFRSSHPLWWAIIMISITALIVAWVLMLFLRIWTHHGNDSTVPEIKHLTYEQARATLKAADLDIAISDSIYDTSLPPGSIVESWPKAGSQVKRGRSVYVTLTAFSPKHVTISMPVTGVSVRQAVSYLNALGIDGIRIVSVPSQYPDLVESAKANGRPLGVGSVLPVNASVVLEVGTYTAPETDTDSIAADTIAPEPAGEDDTYGYSTYEDEE